MKVRVYTHPEFERQFKRYLKKYHSLTDDLSSFLADIKENPFRGVNLGNGVRKVRLGVASKGGGKRGGMRIIAYLMGSEDTDQIAVTLLYIYDKKELENVSDQFIAYLLNQ